MKRIVVHLHLYYLDQVDMLLDKLVGIKDLCVLDLIVTIQQKEPEIESKIKLKFPNAKIIIVKNVGADIWPFIVMLNSVNLENYDYLIKIHTKRFVKLKTSRIPETNIKINGTKWRDYLLEFLEPDNFIKCLDSFINDEKLGMVSSYPVIITDNEKHYWNADVCAKTRDFINKKFKYQNKISFVAGTMFMARAKLFNIIKDLKFKESDFGKFESGKSNQLPHVMERFLGCCILGQGYEIRDVFTPKIKIFYQKYFVKFGLIIRRKIGKIIKSILKFFVKIERTKPERKIIGIRILKIWVWKNKETF
jgi:lipopolysaccharide biosynthesis protein